jgi:hypothetical protein
LVDGSKLTPINGSICAPHIGASGRKIPNFIPPDVRFGSLADILRRNRDVRFAPESGHHHEK